MADFVTLASLRQLASRQQSFAHPISAIFLIARAPNLGVEALSRMSAPEVFSETIWESTVGSDGCCDLGAGQLESCPRRRLRGLYHREDGVDERVTCACSRTWSHNMPDGTLPDCP